MTPSSQRLLGSMTVTEFDPLSMTYTKTHASMMSLGRVSQEREILITPRILLVKFHCGQSNLP